MLSLTRYITTPKLRWKALEIEQFKDPEDNHTFSIHQINYQRQEQLRRLIIMIPGMLTNHTSKYFDHFITALKPELPTCIINYPLTADPATGTTIPDFSDDRYLRQFILTVKSRYPGCRITLIGMSMGGSLAIKCTDLVEQVIAVCPPITGSDVWGTINGIYLTAMKAVFLTGPMSRLVRTDPLKWFGTIAKIVRAKDSKELTSVIEDETGYVVANLTLEAELISLPKGKVTVIHTLDDSIIPYLPDDNEAFARVRRITLASGDHLLFGKAQVLEIVDLIRS